MFTERFILAATLVLAVACDSSDPKPDDDLSIGDLGDDTSGAGPGGGGTGDVGDEGGTDGDGSSDDGSDGDDAHDEDAPGGDPDVDGDGDGDGDVGGGGDEPPAPEFEPDLSELCADGLVFEVQMLDSVTGSCTACASGADHWVGATIYNPCDTDFEVSLYDGYLIGGMELVNHSSGVGMGIGSGSTGRVVTETVAPGEWLSEALYLGVLSDGTYSLTVSFFDTEGHSAEIDFSVE